MEENGRVAGTNLRLRLSTLWIVVMLDMIFADILALMVPGYLGDIVTGLWAGSTSRKEYF